MKYFNLVKTQYRKVTNILVVVIIAILISLTFIISSFYKSQDYYATTGIYDDPLFKVLTLHNEKYTAGELFAIADNLEHVTGSIYTDYFQFGLNVEQLTTDKFSGNIWLYNVPKESLPEITMGTSYPDDNGNYMVCPDLFFPGISYEKSRTLSKKDSIATKDNLNKIFQFKYSNPNYPEGLYIDIQLVGYYAGPHSEYNACYTTNKVMTEIIENAYKDTGHQIWKDSINIFVDNYDNVKNIKQILKAYDLSPSSYIRIDKESIISEMETAKTINLFIYILIFTIMFLLFQKDFLDNKSNYKLLNYLGYSSKENVKIYFLNSLFKILLSIILAIILIVIGIIILNIILYFKPFLLYERKIIYGFTSIFFCFISLILSSILSLICNYKGIKNI